MMVAGEPPVPADNLRVKLRVSDPGNDEEEDETLNRQIRILRLDLVASSGQKTLELSKLATPG
jgi:hypothetical protein